MVRVLANTFIHWCLCKQYKIQCNSQYYKHQLNHTVTNSDQTIKILWEFPIQTDRTVSNNQPDIVLINESTKQVFLIDVTVPYDLNTELKEADKIRKYTQLKFELQQLWNKKVDIIPIVVGSTGIVNK